MARFAIRNDLDIRELEFASKLLDSDFESDIRKKLETVGITVTGITITQFMSKWSKTPFKYGNTQVLHSGKFRKDI
jgi:hypothetical protein